MPPTLDRAALHVELPTDCVSANVVVRLEQIQYPGICGTGFFARRNREIFYFTALHCMRANPGEDPPTFATLMVPYRHTGRTDSPEDFVQFDTGFTVRGSAPDEWLDLIVCPVADGARPEDVNHLHTRCAALPESGAWLDDYVSSEDGQRALGSGHNAGCVVGHPRGSPKNAISYAGDKEDAESVISTEVVVLDGRVMHSNLQGHLGFICDPYPYGFSGFSGSPVFARIETPLGSRFTLLGMAVCGSKEVLNFLPVGRLIEAVTGDD